MKTSRGRSILQLLACLALIVTMPGCVFGFRSLSMDSTSRMPFLNFELKPRTPKSNAPVYNSISRSESDSPQIKPALQTENTAPKSILNLGIKNPFNTKTASGSSSEPQQTAQPQSSIAIPLTFVEGTKASTDRGSNESALDFQ